MSLQLKQEQKKLHTIYIRLLNEANSQFAISEVILLPQPLGVRHLKPICVNTAEGASSPLRPRYSRVC